MKKNARLLCLSDLHLGKEPLVSLQRVWESIIAFALNPENEVDAVLLAGDLIDDERDFFGAFSSLEWGIRRLTEQMPVLAIEGNHDYQLIARLAAQLSTDRFHLLGKGGRWESLSLKLAGQTIRFDGCSFPAKHWEENPFDSYSLVSPEAGERAIGMIHADYAQVKSRYAPVSREDFVRSSHLAWVMGHTHKPALLLESPLLLSLGSPQGLDPSETGLHGAWLLDISPKGEVRAYLQPFALLQWEALSLSLEGKKREEWDTSLFEQLHALEQEQMASSVEKVAIRLTLKGRTPYREECKEWSASLAGREFAGRDGVVYFLADLFDETEPALDIEELARGKDLIAQTARNLRSLQGLSSEQEKQNILEKARKDPHLSFFPDSELSSILVQTSFDLLETLLKQVGEPVEN